MQQSLKNNQGGFLRFIVIVIVIILILVFFGDNIKRFLESDGAMQIAQKIISFIRNLWDNFIKAPLLLIWDKIFVEILWDMILKPLIDFIFSIAR